MATATTGTTSRAFLHSLREYVLDPVRTAAGVAAAERDELAAELAAYEELSERIARVEPRVHVPETPQPMHVSSRKTDERWEAVRTAYRETVMAVDHYDDVYDESLIENVAAELGTDLASAVQPDSSTQFTPQMKEMFKASVERCVDERDSLHAFVETEAESVRACADELAEVVATLDGTAVPDWYADQFQDELDALSERRQRHLQGSSRVDSHDFYTYLYDDEPWTYPVLTSVARLEDAVLVDGRASGTTSGSDRE